LPVNNQQVSRSKHLVDKDISDEKVEEAVKADFALKINLTTNILTYYKDGKIVDQWNIASADVSGEFHKVNGVAETQFTPTGIFTAHDIEHCPSWYPRTPFNPKTGKLAASEVERSEVFKENKNLYGPCGKDNPLGRYAMWFSGAYGVHGNAAEWILDLAVEDRRVSGGCIRNPNERIKQVFDDIISVSALEDYKKTVEENRSKADDARKTVTAYEIMDKVKINVIVGNWESDPVKEGVKTVTKRVEVIVQPTFEKLCTVKYTDPNSNGLSIYSKIPLSGRVGSYRKHEKVEVLETINNIFRTSRGYINGGYMGDCIEQKPRKEWREIEVPVDELEENSENSAEDNTEDKTEEKAEDKSEETSE
jgi:hypothetical protein